MTATLTTLRDRIEELLGDTTNAIWSTGNIDEAVRQALHEYSLARPLREIGTITLSADGREISTATLTGIFEVVEVWTPYTAASPEWPPNKRPFDYWRDEALIYVDGPYEPASGDVVRVFYTKLQSLNGLDSATSTTFPDDHETMLVHGAAGFAATQRSIRQTERVNLSPTTPAQIRAWGIGELQAFRSALETIKHAEALKKDGHVPLRPMDRWERDGGGWS